MKIDGSDSEQRRLDRVVIAAAVAALVGRPAAIRRIEEVPGRGLDEWTRDGRMTIQSSHRMPAPLIRLAPDRGAEEV